MTYHRNSARTAMTAIAAALAISSTPLLAQEAATSQPVADTATEPVAPAADPLAPAAGPVDVTAAPVEATEPTPAAARPAATSVRRTASSTRSAARAEVRSAPAAPPMIDSAADTAAAATPVPPMAETAPVAEPAPLPVAEPTPTASAIEMDEALPIAGGAALGFVLLGGAAAVRRRKRRRQEDADEATKWAYIEAHDADGQSHEPAFVAAPRHDQVPAKPIVAAAVSGPVTKLPSGFDISRFGRHVQAAYRGPTADNPSLSLKNRLRRASFFDLQERRAAEAVAAQHKDKPAMIPPKTNWETRQDTDFLFRRAGDRPALKPAYQD